MKKISIVVPCYNESMGIYFFVEKINEFIQFSIAYEFEVVFVDDGSIDNTAIILSDLCKTYSWIRVVQLTRNFGKEAAMTAGLDYASGDAIVFMDADLQHPPGVVSMFLEHWELGANVVVGRRSSRETDQKAYRVMAERFYRFHNKISDIKLPEHVGDFRLIDKKVANQLKMLRENSRFMKGLFAWVGYAPVFVEYDVAERTHGSSSFNTWRSWNFALEGITSFSTLPLRVWSYIGAVVLAIGIFYSMLIIIKALVYGVSTPGYVTLLSAVIVFGGVQLIGIGILGEYIGRIYIEVKGRPTYLIDNVAGEPSDRELFKESL